MGEFTLNAAKTLISFQQVQNSWWHETQHAFLVDTTVNIHIASLSLMQHGKPDLFLVRGLAEDKVHKVRNSQQVMRHCMQPWQHVPCGSGWGTVGQTAKWYKHYQHFSVQSSWGRCHRNASSSISQVFHSVSYVQHAFLSVAANKQENQSVF